VGVTVMWLVSMVSVVISLVTAAAASDGALLEAIGLGAAAVSFATVGAILVNRLPANSIGWLLALGGLSFAVGNGATGLGTVGLVIHPGSVPGAIWFAWLSEWIWAPAIGSIIALALVYPTGRLLTPRWRPVALGAGFVIGGLAYGGAFGGWTDGVFPIANPLDATGGISDVVTPVATVVIGPLAVVVALLAVASLVVRYRRSVGVERAQLKWFAAVVGFSMPLFLLGTGLFGTSGVAGIVSNAASAAAFVGFALLPVAIGVAILRYRLYEIDRLISRSIGWAIVSAVLGGLFIGLILALQDVLSPVTGSNELAVAGSTLLVFSLFQPIRRRIQRLVDRRFNRARVDAERTVTAFAGRLRDEVDLEQLGAEVTATVGQAVEPSSVVLWLRA
jgi:hypothetical protein